MSWIESLLAQNREWAEAMHRHEPGLLPKLAEGQYPKCLWIGCSDSRIPPTLVMKSLPGEFFVHRNVANLVSGSDTNAMAALQFAVESLKVRHVVVCGHYGCGGVALALAGEGDGAVSKWLEPVRLLRERSARELDTIEDDGERYRRFCEINVEQQVLNVCWSDPVQNAWREGRELTVHGLIYDLETGLLNDMKLHVDAPEPME